MSNIYARHEYLIHVSDVSWKHGDEHFANKANFLKEQYYNYYSTTVGLPVTTCCRSGPYLDSWESTLFDDIDWSMTLRVGRLSLIFRWSEWPRIRTSHEGKFCGREVIIIEDSFLVAIKTSKKVVLYNRYIVSCRSAISNMLDGLRGTAMASEQTWCGIRLFAR